MIRGIVSSNLTPLVSLELLGAAGTVTRIDAEIDTGFNGFLALRREAIQVLRLRHVGMLEGTLADGSSTQFDTYVVTVDWHGAVRTVTVIESDGGNLVGMALLKGTRISIEVSEGGEVSIERI